MSMEICVRVPATSANLGSGFDCLGLAVGLYLEVKAIAAAQDSFHYSGEGGLPDDPNNLIHEGFRATFSELGKTAPKMHFEVFNPIPLARGLGSSSAALVAGAAIADEMLKNPLGPEGIFQLTARIEGHPDNVAPAIFGGFTVSAQQIDGRYLCQQLNLPESWHFLFGVPVFELLTSKARAVLPDSYTRSDVIFNASRTALWSLAVAQNKPELLRLASQDRVHEPYRAPLVPGLTACRERLLAAGAFAAFLSGAGPSIGVICDAATKPQYQQILQDFVGPEGKVLSLAASKGYYLEPRPLLRSLA